MQPTDTQSATAAIGPDASPAHRERLGLPKHRPWLDRLTEAYTIPSGVTGHIDPHDAAFLWDLIEATRPETIIEIGVASGVSTHLLLAALDAAAHTPHADTAVHAYDLHPWCFFDRTKPVGFALHELAPDRAHRVSIHTRATASDAGRAHNAIRFAFIDADHRHPAPALDLLALLPALAPGAWVALHDIRLPELAERHRLREGHAPDWAEQTGPQRLFTRWPFDKIEPDQSQTQSDRPVNTGAVRIPHDANEAARVLREIANDTPWEVEPHPSVVPLLDPSE